MTRKLTPDEQVARDELFELAAEYALQLTRLRNQQFRELGITSSVSWEPPREVVVDALKLIAYEPDQQILLDASMPSVQKLEQRIIQLLAGFAADAVSLAVARLSRTELHEQVRILANMPLEEDADAATNRLQAISELLGTGSNKRYVREVIERIERIHDRERTHDLEYALIEEALTAGK